jgi:hypothetical protein
MVIIKKDYLLMISVVNFVELSLCLCEIPKGSVFQKILVTALTSENNPLL